MEHKISDILTMSEFSENYLSSNFLKCGNVFQQIFLWPHSMETNTF